MIRAALDVLAERGIPFALRGEQPIEAPPPGGDVDVLVGTRDAEAAGRALRDAGFHRLAAPGHPGHRFHLAFDAASGDWLKVDLNLVPRRLGWDLTARDDASLRRFAGYRAGTGAARRGGAARALLARRLPLSVRRRGAVIAVMGPDGAGKGSVVAGLRDRLPIAVRAVYLGEGASGAAYAGEAAAPPPRRSAARLLRPAAALLPPRFREQQHRVRWALRAAARSRRVQLMAWRGEVVLCDRHPLDALVADPLGLGRLLDRGPLGRLLARPDAIVVLEAPGEVLHARKGEHSPEALDRLQRAYRERLVPLGARVVPASGPLEDVVAAASAVVWQALAVRRGW